MSYGAIAVDATAEVRHALHLDARLLRPRGQASTKSWFSRLKERCVWREEFETLDQARSVIGAYIDGYHHRPHSELAYCTPREVSATWKDHDDQLTPTA